MKHGGMVTTEQARHIRERHVAGDAVIGLVVAGEPDTAAPGICIDIDGQWWHAPGSCRYCSPLRPPADWVALTGACETCSRSLSRLVRTDDGAWIDCPDCIDGRKRATLTVGYSCADRPVACNLDHSVPLAVATVKVLQVVDGDDAVNEPDDMVCVYDDGTWERWCVNPDQSDPDIYWLTADLALDRIPTPGVDFVVLLTDVEQS